MKSESGDSDIDVHVEPDFGGQLSWSIKTKWSRKTEKVRRYQRNQKMFRHKRKVDSVLTDLDKVVTSANQKRYAKLPWSDIAIGALFRQSECHENMNDFDVVSELGFDNACELKDVRLGAIDYTKWKKEHLDTMKNTSEIKDFVQSRRKHLG